MSEQLTGIAHIIRAGLRVEDQLSGATIASSDIELSGYLVPRRVQLGGVFNPTLILDEPRDSQVSAFILVHLKKILLLSVETRLRSFQQRESLGEQVMDSLLAGRPSEALFKLVDKSVLRQGFHIVAYARDSLALVARAISIAEFTAVSGHGSQYALSLVPAATLGSARSLFEDLHVRAGVSSRFDAVIDVIAAAGEAERVLSSAASSRAMWLTFQGSELSVLTRSTKEAEEIISTVLGPLAEDSKKMSTLRETLIVFLDCDRHWDTASRRLKVHRQTLAYRLKRISDETGRNIHSSEGISALWIASRAWKMLHGRSGMSYPPET